MFSQIEKPTRVQKEMFLFPSRNKEKLLRILREDVERKKEVDEFVDRIACIPLHRR